MSLSMPVPLGSGFLDSTSTSNTGITPSVGTMNRCQSFSSASSSSDLPYHLVVGLPALSPTMESGTLAEWYLKEGDYFAAGEAIAKIETDKAAMDFEAQDDGFVAKILVSAGQGNDSTFVFVQHESARGPGIDIEI